MTCYKYSITCQDDLLTVDNVQSHVTAFRPISEQLVVGQTTTVCVCVCLWYSILVTVNLYGNVETFDQCVYMWRPESCKGCSWCCIHIVFFGGGIADGMTNL